MFTIYTLLLVMLIMCVRLLYCKVLAIFIQPQGGGFQKFSVQRELPEVVNNKFSKSKNTISDESSLICVMPVHKDEEYKMG